MSGDQEGSPLMTTTAQQTEAATAVTSWLAGFSSALVANDPARVAALFTEDCFWRDLIAFTWNIRTFEGRA
jgi:putative flavoprotein involved in K+ transport